MSGARDGFLRQVRHAVADGNRAGGSPPLPERGGVGYQGAGPDPVGRFVREWSAAGGHAHVVTGDDAAVAQVLEVVRRNEARRVLLGRGAVLDRLGLDPRLRAAGMQVTDLDAGGAATPRPELFAADVGISAVQFLVAETGTLVLASGAGQPRSLSLLPPVHVAVAERSQVLPDLFDLFARLPPGGLPSALTLVTGPSKTGDIELRLVTGVHGPGTVHVVLIDDRSG
jgi:L-lactate dehydrogenase complex protein LldG